MHTVEPSSIRYVHDQMPCDAYERFGAYVVGRLDGSPMGGDPACQMGAVRTCPNTGAIRNIARATEHG
jgi:hypothetical protein